MSAFRFLPAVFLLFALPAQAESTSPVTRFIGRDGNWFEPTNWSTGRVPDASTDVVIAAGAQVVIDPARGRADVAIRDLSVIDGASLTTLPGTIMHTRDERVHGGGQVFYRSSGSEGESTTVGLACDPQNPVACALEPLNGMRMNPTPKSRRDVLLKTGVAQFGLGGSAPATLTQTRTGWALRAGAGHYATLTADTIALDGQLLLTLHYDFEPRAGEQFQIITARQRLVGQFIGLPEGSPVGCTDKNVGLYISYRGGSGNDVVLTAKDTLPSTCVLLPAIQKIAAR